MDAAQIIEGLTDYDRLPVAAIRAAGARRVELLPEFLRLIDDCVETGNTERSPVFLLFHILGEWHEPSAYRPLARFLRSPQAEKIIDDGLTVTAHQVMAAVFDGDPQPLYEVILDENADEFARSAMFETLVTVVAAGRLSRAEAARFLERCFFELQPTQDSVVWAGWQEAVALLGLSELKPLVKDAFDRGIIAETWLTYEEFEEDLAYALAHPDQPDPYWADKHRPFGDTVEELSSWYGFSEEFFAERERATREAARRNRHSYMMASPTSPFVDPSRSVGRNDPCPCGSGKKYKKCCLN